MPAGNAQTTAGIIRACDLVLATVGLLANLPVMLILIIGGLLDTGSPIFSQVRGGRNQKTFTLYKLRIIEVRCGFHADSDTHSTRIRTIIPH